MTEQKSQFKKTVGTHSFYKYQLLWIENIITVLWELKIHFLRTNQNTSYVIMFFYYTNINKQKWSGKKNDTKINSENFIWLYAGTKSGRAYTVVLSIILTLETWAQRHKVTTSRKENILRRGDIKLYDKVVYICIYKSQMILKDTEHKI